MDGKSYVGALLFAALAMTAGGAQAQITEEGIDFVGDLAGVKFGPQRNGHDKCKGNGHGGGSRGDGHDDGECDEDGEAPGPVATEVCYAGELATESAWQRYSCTVVRYNEDYLTGTIEANESYPEVLAAYATTEAETLQVATTEYVTALSVDVAAGDLVGAIETTGGFTFGALDRYLPSLGGPAPGPVVDEVRNYSTTTVTQLSSGDISGAIETTGGFTFGALDRYLPSLGGPAPGPVVKPYRPEMPSGF